MDDRSWNRRSVLRLALATLVGTGAAGSAVAAGAQVSSAGRLPVRVAGIYWTHWNHGIPLRSIPLTYNVVYLFAADQRTRDGRAHWDRPEVATDVRTCRARGQRVLLSIGGEGQGQGFADLADARRLVESVVQIDTELGGTPSRPALDGVDLNTYEGGTVADVAGYLWLCRELRRRLGPAFAVTTPPDAEAPEDQELCRRLLAEGAVDYVAPQFYGGPGASEPGYIVSQTRRWVERVAAGDAAKVVVGFGVEDRADFSTLAEIRQVWPRIRRAHPSIRGAYLWQHRTDADRGWPFARLVAPAITSQQG